jgi:hypothetical protein
LRCGYFRQLRWPPTKTWRRADLPVAMPEADTASIAASDRWSGAGHHSLSWASPAWITNRIGCIFKVDTYAKRNHCFKMGKQLGGPNPPDDRQGGPPQGGRLPGAGFRSRWQHRLAAGSTEVRTVGIGLGDYSQESPSGNRLGTAARWGILVSARPGSSHPFRSRIGEVSSRTALSFAI